MKFESSNVLERRESLKKAETALGISIFGEVTDSFLDKPIAYFIKNHRAKLNLVLGILKLLEITEKNPDSTAEIDERIRLIRQAILVGRSEEPHERTEIAGHTVKTIVSNIRRNNLSLENYSLLECGKGQEGDIVLVEVINPTGSTKKVEDYYGRDQALITGDKLLAVLGNRYSGTSEYGGIPEDGLNISPDTFVDLLCHGGIVGKAESIPARMGKYPTTLKIHGLLSQRWKPVNLRDLFPEWDTVLKRSAPIIANCGTGAEVGKTTTAAAIIKELKSRGLKVAATKLAGTGRYRDLLALRDAGADIFHDFPDIGLFSTYTSPERYIPAITTLINKLNEAEPDIIVAEFGGDIIEANIPTFFGNNELRATIKTVIHTSGDIMGMTGSMPYYDEWGLKVPRYLTYPKDRNELGSALRIEQHVGLPVFNPLDAEECRRITNSILSIIPIK